MIVGVLVFFSAEIANVHGCQIGKIKVNSGHEMYLFKRKALTGEFKLLTSGKLEILWRLVAR